VAQPRQRKARARAGEQLQHVGHCRRLVRVGYVGVRARVRVRARVEDIRDGVGNEAKQLVV